MNATVTHDYYGVPDWLMQEYLASLGAQPDAEHSNAGVVMVGPDWRAVIRKAPRKHIGSLSVGGATVEFSGAQATLDALFEQLHWKTLRGGG